MTALLHFEEKVHCKDLAGAEAFPLLIPRLLSQVLEHLGFPKQPRIERGVSCPRFLSIKRSLYMPLSILLQHQEEVADDIEEDLLRGQQPLPEVEVERTSIPYLSPVVPPPSAHLLLRLLAHPSYRRRHQITALVLTGISWLFLMWSQH